MAKNVFHLMVILTLVVLFGCESSTQVGLPEYQELFNGKDLTGWKTEGNSKWIVKEGTLIGTQGPDGAPGDLFTEATFKDFEVKVEYRIQWPCNSGVWFRYQAPNRAYQADILEFKKPECYSGTLYSPGKMFLAMNEDKTIVNQDGWNTMVIRAEGDHLQIWLNDTQVADVHDNSYETGRIGFQIHAGAQFEPMKIVIREVLLKEI